MALGIERDTIGDIVIEDACATLVCLPELSGYIAENLTKTGRIGVKVSAIGEKQRLRMNIAICKYYSESGGSGDFLHSGFAFRSCEYH